MPPHVAQPGSSGKHNPYFLNRRKSKKRKENVGQTARSSGANAQQEPQYQQTASPTCIMQQPMLRTTTHARLVDYVASLAVQDSVRHEHDKHKQNTADDCTAAMGSNEAVRNSSRVANEAIGSDRSAVTDRTSNSGVCVQCSRRVHVRDMSLVLDAREIAVLGEWVDRVLGSTCLHKNSHVMFPL